MPFLYPEEPLCEVLVLGAGFSRALSPEFMPTTDELGELAFATAALNDDPRVHLQGHFTSGRFEAWLSRLAEDQPDLSTEENYENRSLFHRLSRALHAVLVLRQRSTLETRPPSWLPELLSVLHVRGAIVLTFNYDCLVEYGVKAHELFHFGYGKYEGEVSWYNVTNEQPPFPPQPARWGGSYIRSFRLLKLHGSLDWYWTPGDETGATLNRWDLIGGWEAPEDEDDEARRRHLPGREPFIVPPAATKSAYYRNPVTREMWQQARRALFEAKSVALLGYSLPAADLVVSGMIADALSNTAAVIEVVNREPDPVLGRLAAIGIHTGSVQIHGSGDEAVADYVKRYRARSAIDLTAALRKALSTGRLDIDCPLLIAWSPKSAAAVVNIQRYADSVELHTEAVGPLEKATRRRDDTDALPMFMRDLVVDLERDVPLVAVLPSTQRFDLIGAEGAEAEAIGYSTKWQALTPAGFAPAPGPS